MNEIISIAYENDRPTVLGRELHERLGINSNYTTWFSRMCEYGFAENQDFIALFQKRKTAQGNETTYTDHQLTIDMAKQICMIQRTEIGRQYREYFLEIERKWNDPQAVMARSLIYANRQLEVVTGQLAEANAQLNEANNRIDKLMPKADYYDAVAASEGLTSFRETAKLFGMKEKDFIAFIEKRRLCYRDGHGRLIAYAENRSKKWFELKECTYRSGAEVKTAIYTKITPLGRTKIFELIRKDGIE